MSTQFYSVTFNSKGKMIFKKSKPMQEIITITVPKDNWEYDESTGVWYQKKGSV